MSIKSNERYSLTFKQFIMICLLGVPFTLMVVFLSQFILWLQKTIFGTQSMLYIAPFSSLFAASFSLGIIFSLIVVFFYKAIVERKKNYKIACIFSVITWLIIFNISLFTYTIFNEKNLYHRSISHPLGKEYSYDEIIEVRAFKTGGEGIRNNSKMIMTYELIMYDMTRINALTNELRFKIPGRIVNIGNIKLLDSRIRDDIPRFVSREVINDENIINQFPKGYFDDFKIDENL